MSAGRPSHLLRFFSRRLVTTVISSCKQFLTASLNIHSHRRASDQSSTTSHIAIPCDFITTRSNFHTQKIALNRPEFFLTESGLNEGPHRSGFSNPMYSLWQIAKSWLSRAHCYEVDIKQSAIVANCLTYYDFLRLICRRLKCCDVWGGLKNIRRIFTMH